MGGDRFTNAVAAMDSTRVEGVRSDGRRTTPSSLRRCPNPPGERGGG